MSEELSFDEALEVLSEAHTDRHFHTRSEGQSFIMEFESYGAAYQAVFDLKTGGLVLFNLEDDEEVFAT